MRAGGSSRLRRAGVPCLRRRRGAAQPPAPPPAPPVTLAHRDRREIPALASIPLAGGKTELTLPAPLTVETLARTRTRAPLHRPTHPPPHPGQLLPPPYPPSHRRRALARQTVGSLAARPTPHAPEGGKGEGACLGLQLGVGRGWDCGMLEV
eukprot:scaffold14025_cov73-Isochrysis_galbana.AAC.1